MSEMGLALNKGQACSEGARLEQQISAGRRGAQVESATGSQHKGLRLRRRCCRAQRVFDAMTPPVTHRRAPPERADEWVPVSRTQSAHSGS